MCIGFLIGVFGATIFVAIWYYLFLPTRPCPFHHNLFGPPPQCRYFKGLPYPDFQNYLNTVPSYVTYFLGGVAGVIGGAVYGS